MVVLLACRAVTFAGLFFGMWRSFKTLRSTDPSEADLEDLLQFWTVLSFLSIYNNWVEVFVSWLPFYSEVKFLLLIGLLVPTFKVPAFLFHNVVRQVLERGHTAWVSTVMPFCARQFSSRVSGSAPGVVQWLVGSVPLEEVEAWERDLQYGNQALQVEGHRRD